MGGADWEPEALSVDDGEGEGGEDAVGDEVAVGVGLPEALAAGDPEGEPDADGLPPALPDGVAVAVWRAERLAEGVRDPVVVLLAVRLAEAPSFQKTIFGYDPGCRAAAAYQALAGELVTRVAHLPAQASKRATG